MDEIKEVRRERRGGGEDFYCLFVEMQEGWGGV